MKRIFRIIIGAAWALILALCFYGTVSAEEPATEKTWDFEAELYFWGASIGGKSADGSNIDVEIDEILDSLEFAVMGMAGVRRGKWSFAADVMYLDMKDSGAVAPGVDATVEMTGWVVTPFVGYTLVDTERIALDILGGARYLYLKADLKVDPYRANDSGGNWDGVVGVRGAVNLTDKWYLPYHLDIGAGGSNLTWQALGGIGYRFKWFDLVAAYRYLRWDFDDNKALDHLYFQGPALGIKFGF
jgi:hypothetical protein